MQHQVKVDVVQELIAVRGLVLFQAKKTREKVREVSALCEAVMEKCEEVLTRVSQVPQTHQPSMMYPPYPYHHPQLLAQPPMYPSVPPAAVAAPTATSSPSHSSKVLQLDANHHALWEKASTMTPHPKMKSYHNAFIKKYLDMLLYHQQNGHSCVTQSENKRLAFWVHNQKTYLGEYERGVPGNKFGKHNEKRYIQLLNSAGVYYTAK